MESHCDTMPPQASSALNTTACVDAGSTSGESVAWAAAVSRQQAGSLGAEQQRACVVDEQHEDTVTVFLAGAAARRWSAAMTAGSTLWISAQASVSAGVLQQQFAKHCSAVTQPQGLSIQGNGVERSFAASRFSVAGLALPGATAPSGNGKPDATTA
jgi:hypothetical protein